MRKGKKIASVFMAVTLTIMLSIPAVSAEGATTTSIGTDVEIAKNLGIVMGDGNGVTAEYLAKDTQRIQAAIMLLRLIGKEDQAKAFTGTDNFKDAGKVSWSEAKNILAYLKAHPEYGFAGYSNGNFGVEDKILPQQFYKVLLTVMGFETGKDFKYADTLKFAESKGLTKVATLGELTNNDMAVATVEALKAKVNGSDKTVADVLVSTGADRTKFEALGLVQPPPPPPAPPVPVYIPAPPAPPAPPADTTPPTVVTPCTSATITTGEHISIVFSEHIGNKEDVQNSILGGTSGFDGPFQFNWNDTNNTLTVTNGSDTTATFAQDVTVDLTDLAGNIATNAIIIDIP